MSARGPAKLSRQILAILIASLAAITANVIFYFILKEVAGIEFIMNCRDLVAEDIYINGNPLDPDGTYELATNNYIAHGGSGFSMLERNTTQFDTGISIRDVVRAAITNHYTLPQDTDGDGEEDVCVEDGRILPFF